jgi:hypothetical protein
MDTIGKLLENNLSPHRSKAKNATRPVSRGQQKVNGISSFGKIDHDLDRQWQRMWDLKSEESQLLDQI